jgi:uncharacterized delta-60 repeat protein
VVSPDVRVRTYYLFSTNRSETTFLKSENKNVPTYLSAVRVNFTNGYPTAATMLGDRASEYRRTLALATLEFDKNQPDQLMYMSAIYTKDNGNGYLNRNFGYGGLIRGALTTAPDLAAKQIIRNSKGKLVIIGDSTLSAATRRNLIFYRLNDDGTADFSFGQSGLLRLDMGEAVSVLHATLDAQDRMLVVALRAADAFQGAESTLFRFTSDGKRDMTFGTQGRIDSLWSGRVTTARIVVRADGHILVSHSLLKSKSPGTTQMWGFQGVDANGAPDLTFGTAQGRSQIEFTGRGYHLNGVALDAKNRLVIAGAKIIPVDETAEDGLANIVGMVARVNAAGTALDDTFGTNGFAPLSLTARSGVLKDLLIAPDGKIVAVGGIYQVDGQAFSEGVVARFLDDGKPDTNFGNGGMTITNRPREYNSVVLQANGRILATGLGVTTTSYQYVVTRLLMNGSADPGYNMGGATLGQANVADLPFNDGVLTPQVRNPLVLPDGSLLLAGTSQTPGEVLLINVSP